MQKVINQVYENKDFLLWCIAGQSNNDELFSIYKNITELIMFWFNKMNKLLHAIEGLFIVSLKSSYNYVQFFNEIEIIPEIDTILEYTKTDNRVELEITPQLFQFLRYDKNLREKEFIQKLMNILDIKVNEKEFDSIFANQYIKKFITVNSVDDGYMIPMNNIESMRISHSDENLILDDVGTYLYKELGISHGIIQDNKIINKVVEMLYCRLKEYICKFKKEDLLKYIYINIEQITSELYLRYNYYANNSASYPEHLKEIQDSYNDINRTSVAIKFLIELTSALKFNGDKMVSKYDTEYMLAIASEIIEWAYTNDLIYYKMIDSPIRLLDSNRIGFDRSIVRKYNKVLFDSREEEMSVNGIEINSLLGKFHSTDDLISKEEFKKAFFHEFGFSLDEFETVNMVLLEYAQKEDKFLNGICEIRIDDLMTLLKDKIRNEQAIKVIERLSLQERSDFLIPCPPYKVEDIYPWRFNRELSLIRRPLVIYNGKVIYGYRMVYNSVFFLMELISSCKLKAKSSEMKEYISKIEQIKGQGFNDLVFNNIISMGDFIVYKNVKKISGVKLRGKDNNELGDIDILCISEEKGVIKLIETKDFHLSKNFYEIHNEYTKMFDVSNSKSFYCKHMKRVQWIKDHLDEVKKYYNLSNKKWKISYLFVVNETLVSKDIYNLKIEITTLRDLKKDRLMKE